jgi:predicted ATPase/DNA-binding CsgD family transcriptional regulator
MLHMDKDQLSEAQLYAPLSARELDILHLLAQDLSDREIADKLVVAPTTVKWYNRQIFNKLGVNSRHDAVKQAAALGLLNREKPRLPSHNLPTQLTPFVGRLHELDALGRLVLEPQTRLITLLAPGGMGKTRLALALGEQLLPQFVDGVFFVPLAGLTAHEEVSLAVAEAIGIRFSSDQRSPRQQLLDHLRSKHLLLILDNFEHLLAAAPIITEILEAAATVKLLITSRERPNLRGETVYPLEGLAYPEMLSDAHANDYAAVQLFIRCAQRATAHFTPENEAEIVRICQLVQGMPLAIELAAAWVGSLNVAYIAAEIQHNADFLQTTMRDVPERLRSVRAVFEAAWRQLDEHEQRVFRRLSVFRGGFTRQAAQEVAGANVQVLASLTDRALLWWRSREERYEMHELLRQYAAHELEVASEAQIIANAHRDYFTRWGQQQALALQTQQHLSALASLDAEIENIRVAFARAIENGSPDALEPFGDLWYYYDIRCWYFEGEKYFTSAIDRLEPGESVALARMIAAYTVCLHGLGRYERLLEFAQRSAEMLRRFGAERGNLVAFWYVGLAHSIPGDYEKSVAIFQEVLAMAQRFNDQWAVGIVVFLLGQDALNLRQNDLAKAYLAQSLAVLTSLHNEWGIPYPLFLLGHLAYLEKDFDEAERRYDSLLVHARKARHPLMIEAGLSGFVYVAIGKHDFDLAKQLAEDLLDLQRDSRRVMAILETQVCLAEINTALKNYTTARQHLLDGLLIAADVMATYLLYAFLIAAELLLEQHRVEQAVEVLSFFHQNPEHTALVIPEPEKPQKLVARSQALLPHGVYAAAWARGATLTIEAVRTIILAHL